MTEDQAADNCRQVQNCVACAAQRKLMASSVAPCTRTKTPPLQQGHSQVCDPMTCHVADEDARERGDMTLADIYRSFRARNVLAAVIS